MQAIDLPLRAGNRGIFECHLAARERLRTRLIALEEGGAFPDAIKALTWNYSNPSNPAPEEVLREINGKALADVFAPPAPPKHWSSCPRRRR